MSKRRTIELNVDIKQRSYIHEETVTQNDGVTFILRVLSDGEVYDLSDFTSYTLANKKIDGSSALTLGEKTGENEITFNLGTSELSAPGRVDASIQMYGANGRVSTLPFSYIVSTDLAQNSKPSVTEKTLIELVLFEGPIVIQNAKDATAETNAQLDILKARLMEDWTGPRGPKGEKGEKGDTGDKGDKGDTGERGPQGFQGVQGETGPEGKKGDKGDTGAGLVILGSKNSPSELPTTGQLGHNYLIGGNLWAWNGTAWIDSGNVKGPKGDKGETGDTGPRGETGATGLTGPKGDPGKDGTGTGTVTKINGVLPNDRGEVTLPDLLEINRLTSTISQGSNIINATQDSLASVEVEGNTLVPLGNSNLEAGKKYVLADKKTKVVVDGLTHPGVAKFTKGSTTVTKATFEGKVSGNNVTNPHKAHAQFSNTLLPPSEADNFGGAYRNIETLNNSSQPNSTTNAGQMAQHRFSFNIIEQIERTLGLIPRTTLAEKVQWVRDNTENLVSNWHGFGSSVGGNKATFSYYAVGKWFTGTSNASSTVTKLSIGSISSNVVLFIQDDGFVHFLVHAEPSDGTTPSVINTDYVELNITLKPTAQLNTRPRIIRVANFEGKVAGSNVENPHKAGRRVNSTLTPPTDMVEYNQSGTLGYERLQSLNGTTTQVITSTNGQIAQEVFSFNLIEEVERNIGKIPRSTVADKVAWLKNNLNKFTAFWHGSGSSVGGYKATLTVRNGLSWHSGISHSLSTTSRLAYANPNPLNIHNYIDENGFVHYLAYAEPSDGTTPSVINTDYIDLEIELKENADFTNPKVPLYEVSDSDYAKILVDWNADEVVKRYPAVEGVQHINGLNLTAEGENLLPPFTEWNLHANARVVSSYELLLTATAPNQRSEVVVEVVPNQVYRFEITKSTTNNSWVRFLDGNGATINTMWTGNTMDISSPTKILRIVLDNNTVETTFSFKNPMLTLGSQPKPFIPRNPSSLLMDVKLGKIGNVADMAYEQDGRWMLHKAIEKDVSLDSITSWTANSAYNYTNYKRVVVNNFWTKPISSMDFKLTKFDGAIVRNGTPAQTVADLESNSEIIATGLADRLDLTVPNALTGFTNTMIPGSSDWKRYFNGWKYTDGTTWTSLTGNGQTATGQQALDTKPTDYTPYKLSYVLATPVITDITDKVEGPLKINGQTQVNVETGLVVREKANPMRDGTSYYIMSADTIPYWKTSRVSFKISKMLQVYRNGVPDNKWVIGIGGNIIVTRILETNYDPNAVYTVTYLAEPKGYTATATNVKVSYSNSTASTVSDLVTTIEDMKRDETRNKQAHDQLDANTMNVRKDLTSHTSNADIHPTKAKQDEWDKKSAPGHKHVPADITGLADVLATKAPTVHGHTMDNVSGLADALKGKSDTTHKHTKADVEGLETELQNLREEDESNWIQMNEIKQLIPQDLPEQLENLDARMYGVDESLFDHMTNENHMLANGGFLGGPDVDYHNIGWNKIYQVGDIIGATNAPPESYGVLITHRPLSTSYGYMEFTSVVTHKKYVNTMTENGFKGWKEVGGGSGTGRVKFFELNMHEDTITGMSRLDIDTSKHMDVVIKFNQMSRHPEAADRTAYTVTCQLNTNGELQQHIQRPVNSVSWGNTSTNGANVHLFNVKAPSTGWGSTKWSGQVSVDTLSFIYTMHALFYNTGAYRTTPTPDGLVAETITEIYGARAVTSEKSIDIDGKRYTFPVPLPRISFFFGTGRGLDKGTIEAWGIPHGK